MTEKTSMNEVIAFLKKQYPVDTPVVKTRTYRKGQWTYSGDWLRGPVISGDDPMSENVHELWLAKRDERS